MLSKQPFRQFFCIELMKKGERYTIQVKVFVHARTKHQQWQRKKIQKKKKK